MKAGLIGNPDIYLGAKVKQMKINKGVTAWTISLSKYVNEAVKNSEKWIQENVPESKHSSRATNPFPTDYHPYLDTTNELDEDQATYYQPQIGILHWIVELGHLQTAFHIYAYLKKRHNSKLALDPSHPEISTKQIGQTLMGVSRRQYLTMPQSQQETQ